MVFCYVVNKNGEYKIKTNAEESQWYSHQHTPSEEVCSTGRSNNGVTGQESMRYSFSQESGAIITVTLQSLCSRSPHAEERKVNLRKFGRLATLTGPGS